MKEQYERKLNDMQNELKKLHAAKKEQAKLEKNQSHLERQLKTLRYEIGEMKKTKVCIKIHFMFYNILGNTHCFIKLFFFSIFEIPNFFIIFITLYIYQK